MFGKYVFRKLFLVISVILFSGSVVQSSQVTEKVVNAPFEDVMADLKNAVIGRGFKVDYEAYISDMLKRTAGDVGADKQIYREARFIQFCSAVLSRAVMAADPAHISTCPYILFAYERADEAGRVRVGFRRLDEAGSKASKAAIAKVNSVLNEIITEAADQ